MAGARRHLAPASAPACAVPVRFAGVVNGPPAWGWMGWRVEEIAPLAWRLSALRVEVGRC